MTAKRTIEPLSFDGLSPSAPPTGTPELTWIAPSELLVDEAYQRGLSEKGMRLIRRIVEHFDWRKFKPPTCVWTDDGLEVLDGQHSAIAAATHPSILQIPVMIVDAPQISERASAFIGINKDRLGMTNMQLHAAALIAGDSEAQAIERICVANGVRVLRHPPANGGYKPRDTVAVSALAALIKRTGEAIAMEVVRVLADAELAPLTAQALRAAETLIVEPEYADSFEPADLSKAIVALGVEGEKEAAVFAATHCIPKWKGLVAVWFKKVKKRKSAPDSMEHPKPVSSSKTPPKTVPKRFLGSSYRISGPSPSLINEIINMGEPAPGRSALDQRRAEQAGKK